MDPLNISLYDNVGHVRLVDHMGTDECVADAARVSYQTGTRPLRANETLVRYLMRHEHWTPFEMTSVKLRVKCPLFVARQVMRHRLFSYNEVSLRYSEACEDIWAPTRARFNLQSDTNRQGSGEACVDPAHAERFVTEWARVLVQARTLYDDMLHAGVAREVARGILPVAQFTEFYMCGNLRTWLHFCRLRCDSHAQSEISELANGVLTILRALYPVTVNAWIDYERDSVRFSRPDGARLHARLHGNGVPNGGENSSARELDEFEQKLARLTGAQV